MLAAVQPRRFVARQSSRVWLAAFVLLAACSRSKPPTDAGTGRPLGPPSSAPSSVPPSSAPPVRERVANQPQPAVQNPPVPSRETKTSVANAVAAPANGCALQRSHELAEPAERALALYLAGQPGLLALTDGGRSLTSYLSTADRRLTRSASRALEAKALRASVLCDARCELAIIDERGRLLLATLDAQGLSEPSTLASGVDRRFAPALARVGEHTLIAYTQAVSEAMHTFVLRRSSGTAPAPRDVTPAGHGASAPTFVSGASEPTLVFIDARAGYSPLLELRFDARGDPLAAQVRTPVSQPYTPPALQAVRWESGVVELFFTAVGRAAMTAIGRVPLRESAEPSALLASRGYGEREFSLARSRRRALIAAEQPLEAGPADARALALKLSDGVQTHDVAWFEGERAGARPSLVSGPEPGSYWLAYVRGHALHAALLACDDR